MGRILAAIVGLVLSVGLAACADQETERLAQLRAETARAAGAEADRLDVACRSGDTHACDQAAYYRNAAASQAAMAEEEHQTSVAEGQERAARADAASLAILGAAAIVATTPRPVYAAPNGPTHCTSFVTGSLVNTDCY